jgi:hypothetical protein
MLRVFLVIFNTPDKAHMLSDANRTSAAGTLLGMR